MPKRCRKCPACKQAHRQKQMARISLGLSSSASVAFLTLTSTPDTSWPKIMLAFTRLISYLRRTQPHLQYAAAKDEGVESNMRHLHVALIHWQYHSQADLSAWWERQTGAWNVDIRRVPSTNIPSYLAKYLSKPLIGTRKALTYSAKWPKLPVNKDWYVRTHIEQSEPPGDYIGETPTGGLVRNEAPSCLCLPDVHPVSLGTWLWLGSFRVHSPPPSLVPLVM